MSEKLQQSLRKKNTLLHQKLKSAQRQKQGKEWQLFNFKLMLTSSNCSLLECYVDNLSLIFSQLSCFTSKLHVLISETLAARGSIWKFE